MTLKQKMIDKIIKHRIQITELVGFITYYSLKQAEELEALSEDEIKKIYRDEVEYLTN